MRNFFLLLLVVLLVKNFAFAQDSTSTNIKAKNAVFFELFGSGLIYSFNYERVFDNRFTLRGGVSYLDSDFLFNKAFILPITSSYLLPTDEDSHIEFGMGTTVLMETENTDFLFGPIIGFREQDLQNGGGYFRISFIPMISITSDTFIFPFGGLSFGASF